MPREWVAPPDVDTADGELLDEGDEEDGDGEYAGMLASDQRTRHREERRKKKDQERYKDNPDDDGDGSHTLAGGRKSKSTPAEETDSSRFVAVKDTSGRGVPVAERAPVPRK